MNLVDGQQFKEARPLDVHVWSDYPEVNGFVSEVFDDLVSLEGNKAIGKKNLKVILLDLYVAWCADPELKIMFSRNKNSYAAKSRYNELHISRKAIGIVDALEAAGYINQKIGFQDARSGISFQSRIWPTEKLIKKFREAKFGKFCVTSHEDRETIVLRDKNGKDIDYNDTAETRRMRSDLKKYNELLDHTHIDLMHLEESVVEIGDRGRRSHLQIGQHAKFVRRVFNESSWKKGGRFYGGWWQRCPKDLREFIVLDGIITAEIDYSGLHIVILYGLKGIDYWKDVGTDPYMLPPIEGIDPSINMRQVSKLLLLTAINAADEKKAFKAFRQQCSPGTPEKKLTDKQLASVLSSLKTLHKPIADKLNSGAGIDLMYIDSQITERLINHFTGEGVPMLTVHDSYIVPFGYDNILRDQMKSAFGDVVGIADPKVEHTTEYYTTAQEEKDIDESDIVIASERHKKELAQFKEFKGKPDREFWVPDWTMYY